MIFAKYEEASCYVFGLFQLINVQLLKRLFRDRVYGKVGAQGFFVFHTSYKSSLAMYNIEILYLNWSKKYFKGDDMLIVSGPDLCQLESVVLQPSLRVYPHRISASPQKRSNRHLRWEIRTEAL